MSFGYNAALMRPTIPPLERPLLNDILLWIAAGGAVLACLAAVLAWLRPPARDARLDALLEGLERTERALRAHGIDDWRLGDLGRKLGQAF
ncbi:hypothetical protein G6F31_015052 [Rhizopus arrhizus]|nr:hypothetical protein G6F31_015052 [Rhizopus arrhizus]